MRHFNNAAILCACSFCFIGEGVLGQDALERSEQIVAEAKAADPSISRRSLPTQFQDTSSLSALKEADFAAMPLTDLRLKAAWIDLLCGVPNGFPNDLQRDSPQVAEELRGANPHRVHAFFDLKRRGDAATPQLLQIASELSETDFETSVIGLMPTLPGINVAPYLEYCRRLLLERPRSTQIVYAAMLLARHGTQHDISLIENVATNRPFFRESLHKSALLLRSRFGNPTQPKSQPGDATAKIQPTESVRNSSSTPQVPSQSEEPASSTPWSIVVVLIAAVLGLLWLVLKRRS